MIKAYLIAFAMCLGVSIVLCLVSLHFGHNADAAKALAALPFFAIQKLAEAIEKKLSNKSEEDSFNDFSFRNFKLPQWAIAVSCFLLAPAIMAAANALLLIVVGVLGPAGAAPGPDSLDPAYTGIALFIPPIYAASFFGLGCWAGIHSRPYGAIFALAGTAAGFATAKLTDFLFGPDQYRRAAETFSMDSRQIVLSILVTCAGCCIMVALGFWRGRAVQRTVYVQHLMKLLPAATRDTFLDLMHNEAKALSASRRRP